MVLLFQLGFCAQSLSFGVHDGHTEQQDEEAACSLAFIAYIFKGSLESKRE